MLTWKSADDDGHGLESARILPGSGHALRVLSRLVRVEPSGDFTASYRLVVSEDGSVSRLSIATTTGSRERHLTLNRTEDGYWLFDTGSGGTRTDFDGAVDVDVAGSPLFNALPIRRLALHREAAEHLLPVVYVSLPDLEATLVRQTYKTVSVDADGGGVVEYSSEDFRAEIVVDADGFVVEYPGVASRLSPAKA